MHPDLRTSVASATVVAFDCEMTGPDKKRDAICALGAVRLRGGQISDETFSAIVDPRRPIGREAQKIHGITDADVAGKPPLEAVLPAFREFIADAVPVAHVASYDLAFLAPALKRARLPALERVLDTAVFAATLTSMDTRDLSLDAVCRRFGLDLDGRHTALGDARLAARLFVAFLPYLQHRNALTLDHALNWGDAHHPNALR